MKKIVTLTMVLGLTTLASMNASAGNCSPGFIADLYCLATGDKAGANAADYIHDQYKRVNPKYGRWEERTTRSVRSGMGLKTCEDVYNRWGDHVGRSCN